MAIPVKKPRDSPSSHRRLRRCAEVVHENNLKDAFQSSAKRCGVVALWRCPLDDEPGVARVIGQLTAGGLGRLIIQPMVIRMDESRIRTVAQVRAVFKNTHPLEFTAANSASNGPAKPERERRPVAGHLEAGRPHGAPWTNAGWESGFSIGAGDRSWPVRISPRRSSTASSRSERLHR